MGIMVLFLQHLQCYFQGECGISASFAEEGATLLINPKIREVLGKSICDGGDAFCCNVS
jgi:hypothetical protein